MPRNPADRPTTEPRPDDAIGFLRHRVENGMPLYQGDVDEALAVARAQGRAEAAQGAAPRAEGPPIHPKPDPVYWAGYQDGRAAERSRAAPRAEGLRMALQEVVDQLDDYGPNGPGFARAIEHARSALAEAAQGAAPLPVDDIAGDLWHQREGWNASEGAAPRAEGLDLATLSQACKNAVGPWFDDSHERGKFSPVVLASRIEREYRRLSRPSDERVPEPEATE